MVIVKYINQHYNPKGFTGKTYDKVSIEFLKNNKSHRYYGPAEIHEDNYKEWYFNSKFYGGAAFGNNKKYNQKKFLKDISKLWLL